MSSLIIKILIRFVVLILLQALILNNINLLGYINPYIYILFIILYPINNNRILFIFISFLLGLTLDIFSDSGGVHAAACVTIAYIRPSILKFAFGAIYEHQTMRFSITEFGPRLTYFSILIIVHHLILFSLEIFNISQILLILKKALFSGLFTLLISLLLVSLFSEKTK